MAEDHTSNLLTRGLIVGSKRTLWTTNVPSDGKVVHDTSSRYYDDHEYRKHELVPQPARPKKRQNKTSILVPLKADKGYRPVVSRSPPSLHAAAHRVSEKACVTAVATHVILNRQVA